MKTSEASPVAHLQAGDASAFDALFNLAGGTGDGVDPEIPGVTYGREGSNLPIPLGDAGGAYEGIVLPPEDVDLTETRATVTAKDLRAMEDRLLSSSMDIIEGVMRAPELMGGEPPAHWVTEYGYERACRMHAAAQSGQLNSKEAPVYIKTAEGMVKSIIKSRATQMTAPVALNVAIINQTNHYEYTEVEVEDD